MLSEVKELPAEAAKTLIENKADAHTAFMFKNGHSRTNLPKWNTHTPAKKPVPDIFKPKINNPIPSHKNTQVSIMFKFEGRKLKLKTTTRKLMSKVLAMFSQNKGLEVTELRFQVLGEEGEVEASRQAGEYRGR